MAGADRPGVDAGIGERAVVDGAVLVADEPVGGDEVGIELDLGLRVEGDGLEGRGQVVPEERPGLVEVVDVGVEPVALVGELLEQGVVVVAHADADADQLDAGRRVLADAAQDRRRRR